MAVLQPIVETELKLRKLRTPALNSCVAGLRTGCFGVLYVLLNPVLTVRPCSTMFDPCLRYWNRAASCSPGTYQDAERWLLQTGRASGDWTLGIGGMSLLS